jgi:uncharacterized protein
MFSFSYYSYMIPAFILMALTQWYVSSAYKKWSKRRNQAGLTGIEATQQLIQYSGLSDVRTGDGSGRGLQIQLSRGKMSDHYDPRSKTINLSEGVGQGNSVASLAIAAHELGHAQQDHEEYFLLKLRGAMVPMVNVGSYLGWIMIFAGLLLNFTGLAYLGLIVFSGGALFALATLPVELDASARAKKMLLASGIINSGEEMAGVNKVLNAAALTYVAGLFTAVMQLLYFASMVTGRRR